MSVISSASIRNGFFAISRAMGAFSLGVLAVPSYAQAVSSADVGDPVSTLRQSAPGDAIRPFTFRASDETLADLRRRIGATKWPSREQGNSRKYFRNSFGRAFGRCGS
jgi:hypothetical protein